MKNKLKIGDSLYRSKGLVEHVGNYLGSNKVIHNSPDGNAQISSFEQYSQGKTVKVISNNLSTEDSKQFLHNTKKKLDKNQNYNVFSNNCEQFSSDILDMLVTSPQLNGAIFGGGIGATFGYLSNSKNKLQLILIGAFLGCVFENKLRKYDFTI